VIGVIVGDREESACHKKPKKATPCEANDDKDKPGYEAEGDANQLYFLSGEPGKPYPPEFEARKSGTLWLTVNDADGYRNDNLGLFFVKVTIR
jgi:hypothetical protein